MAWGNYNGNNGWNGGYNNRGGWNQGPRNSWGQGGGYRPNPGPRPNYHGDQGGYDRYEPTSAIPFSIGQMVRHKATDTMLSVVRIGREQVECRLPDLTSNWFYVHELEAISDQQ